MSSCGSSRSAKSWDIASLAGYGRANEKLARARAASLEDRADSVPSSFDWGPARGVCQRSIQTCRRPWGPVTPLEVYEWLGRAGRLERSIFKMAPRAPETKDGYREAHPDRAWIREGKFNTESAGSSRSAPRLKGYFNAQVTPRSGVKFNAHRIPHTAATTWLYRTRSRLPDSGTQEDPHRDLCRVARHRCTARIGGPLGST
jgi:hypothetical protein